ncbi:MAG: 4-alpha-glucanotransferase [Saccharofermentans sp.]|jgi:4-alpha-glucanotransferase|nr:4-alpha-glucanotransferase [Mageeibacillus sp.]MCI1264533.1 4-alpha-glucanotransferase [Saccharofermentans sp.]MCI1274682.1 4-alpha-glucanotransferase [Saccharofermentans sp.]MCI2044564.1 4-alpha-glucanotransferase [Mageeibacillus sp.]
MKRGGGVLMHIASLPGPFGIGVFGEEAIAFAKQLAGQGMKYWQVLPFSYPGMGNSPYQSFSAFAGNWLFIDPRRLMRRGFLTPNEVVDAEYNQNKWRVDYDYLRTNREEMLRKAFGRVDAETSAQIDLFLKENVWASDVSMYQSIKDDNFGKPWWEWSDERLKNYDMEALQDLADSPNYRYHAFVQYLFMTEWAAVKKEINEAGISIIGDMPFYVSGDSADVWASRDLFKMAGPERVNKLLADYEMAMAKYKKITENFDGNTSGADDSMLREPRKPKTDALVFEKVAGVPPDYFSADGQLWGNPIYNWEKMKATGYKWWMNRIAMNYRLYDYLRIDHFRAFSSYWEVDANAENAREGEWLEGPGLEFFEEVDKNFGDRSRLIAEDLGEMTPDLEGFMREVGIPGMRVMEFAFNPGDDSSFMPHNFSRNCVAYTGTHDNNTLLGWLWDAPESTRNFCFEYCGFSGDNWGDGGTHSASCRAIIRTLWMSHAGVTIIPMQDMLGYGGDTRMNVPGTASGNWVVRFTREDMESIDDEWYRSLNRIYYR